jgi:FkbM family methyltransferase
MASVKSPLRSMLKPLLFKVLGKRGYKWAQYYAKKKDIQNRLVEEIEMELLPSLVKEKDEVLDIGANYAYYTERLARLVTKGKVYAFEPIPFTFDVARMLVKKFRLANVEIYQKGVGEKTATVEFSVPVLDFGSLSAGQAHVAGRKNEMIKGSDYYVSEKSESFNCEVVDIDSFLSDRLTNLTFIKIDIEGAEYFALKGMESTLQKFKPVILIEIVPLFLKSFGIELPFFQNYIQNTIGYEILEYNSTTKKLNKLQGEIAKDRNYILIHKERLLNYNNLIA